MTKEYRRLTEEATQGVLLDDPAFLREIVERKLQEFLEAEMTEHVGAAPYELTTERKGAPQRPQDAHPRCVLRGLRVEQEPSENPHERNLGWLTLSILPD